MLTPKKRQKPVTLLVLLTLLLVLAVFSSGRKMVSFAEEILLTVVAPVQGVFQHLTVTAETFVTTLRDFRELARENKQLKKEVARLKVLDIQVTELSKENNRLRRMLDFAARSDYELISAQVIARNPDDWFQTLTINRGSLHGVETNMAVVTSEGLIGSVSSVTKISSQVHLLTDPGTGDTPGPAVSAMVQRSRDPGMVGVVESAPENPGYLRMVNLPRDANIQPGDAVISSGLGGVFPKGLLIGYVEETGVDEHGILQYALLQPAANFYRLEEVFVVVPPAVTDVEE